MNKNKFNYNTTVAAAVVVVQYFFDKHTFQTFRNLDIYFAVFFFPKLCWCFKNGSNCLCLCNTQKMLRFAPLPLTSDLSNLTPLQHWIFYNFFHRQVTTMHLHLFSFKPSHTFVARLLSSSITVVRKISPQVGPFKCWEYAHNLDRSSKHFAPPLIPPINIRLCARKKSWRQPTQSLRANMQTLISLCSACFFPSESTNSAGSRSRFLYIASVCFVLFFLFFFSFMHFENQYYRNVGKRGWLVKLNKEHIIKNKYHWNLIWYNFMRKLIVFLIYCHIMEYFKGPQMNSIVPQSLTKYVCMFVYMSSQ